MPGTVKRRERRQTELVSARVKELETKKIKAERDCQRKRKKN